MRTHHAFMLVAGLLAISLLGCEEPDGTEGQDARVWEPSDASVWQPLTIDAGPPRDGGSCSLAFDPIPTAALPACDAPTQACLAACTEEPCRDACYLADTFDNPNVSCRDCITVQLLACSGVNGCEAQNSAFLCCSAEMCPPGSPESCAADECGVELQGVFACLGTATTCLDYYNATYVGGCFDSAAPTDAGSMDTDAGMPAADGGM